MKSGKLKWHYQVIRHDIWEADIAISPVLYDAQVDGKPRKAIATMRADGYLFMLDRETGKPLTRVEDRPVTQDSLQKTAATQPFPVGADSALPPCDEWKKASLPRGFDLRCDYFTPASVEKPNLLTPKFGMRVAPMAYNPDTGYFYATGNASLGWLRRDENPWFFSNTFNQRVPGLNALGYGVLAAIDSRTNKVVWKKEFRPGRPTGAMTTAGGLMFQWAPDGNVQAYDAKAGNLLWEFQIGAAGRPPFVRDRRRAVCRGNYANRCVGIQAGRHCRTGSRANARAAGAVPGSDHRHDTDRDGLARARHRLHGLPLHDG